VTEPLGRIVLTAGVVYSQRFPFSTTLIVDDGVIAWIGDEEGLSGQMLPGDRVIDCEGAFIAPAFMDANAGGVHQLRAEVGAAFFEEDGELIPYSLGRHPEGNGDDRVRLPAENLLPRYDGELTEPIADVVDDMLNRRQVAVVPAATEPAMLAELARYGVPFAFGSYGNDINFWQTLRFAVYGSGDGISGRAAFNAATRAGWRIIGTPEAGEIAVGTVARVNMWRCDHLLVQTPDRRITAWSTDVRAGTPPLPDLSPDAALPTLWATMTGMTMTVTVTGE
jgi:imidazolonepropionase-like amidohydrolase